MEDTPSDVVGSFGKLRRVCRLFAIPLMLLFCTLVYYFGELADAIGWDSPHLGFFYGVHDIQRLLFLFPIVYAGYTAGAKAAVIVATLSFALFFPRAIFISPFPDPILRPVLFTLIASAAGILASRQKQRRK